MLEVSESTQKDVEEFWEEFDVGNTYGKKSSDEVVESIRDCVIKIKKLRDLNDNNYQIVLHRLIVELENILKGV